MRESVVFGILVGSIGVASLGSGYRPASARSTVNQCLPVGHWRVIETRVTDDAGCTLPEREAASTSTIVVRVSSNARETSSIETGWNYELARGSDWMPCSGVVASDDQCRLELRCSEKTDATNVSFALALTRSGTLSGTETIRRNSDSPVCAASLKLWGERVSPLQLDIPSISGSP